MQFKDKVRSAKESMSMKFAENLVDVVSSPRGILERIVRENGVVISHISENVVVQHSRKILSHLLAEGDADYVLTQFAMGDGHHVGGPGQGGDLMTPIAPTDSETALEQELYRENINSFNYPDDTSVQFVTVIEQGEGQGGALPDPCAYTEAAMFTNATFNRMFCIKSFPAMIKNDLREFEFKWTIVF